MLDAKTNSKICHVLCLKDNERINMGMNVSALIERPMTTILKNTRIHELSLMEEACTTPCSSS